MHMGSQLSLSPVNVLRSSGVMVTTFGDPESQSLDLIFLRCLLDSDVPHLLYLEMLQYIKVALSAEVIFGNTSDGACQIFL